MTSHLDTTSGVADSSSSVVDRMQNSSDIPADGLSWKTGYSPTPLGAMTSSADGFENVSFVVDLDDPPFTAMNSEGDWCSESSQSSQHIITEQKQQQQKPLETKQSTSLIDVLRKQADTTAADQKTKSLDDDLTSVFVPHMVFSCIIMLTGVGSLFGCFGFAFAGTIQCLRISTQTAGIYCQKVLNSPLLYKLTKRFSIGSVLGLLSIIGLQFCVKIFSEFVFRVLHQ